MKWEGKRESRNVEDRRGQGGGFRFPFPRGGGGGPQFPGSGGRFPIPGGGRGGGGIGIIGILIILGLILLFGGDPRILLPGGTPESGGQAQREAPYDRDAFRLPGPRQPGEASGGQGRTGGGFPAEGGQMATDREKSFVSVVLAKTEDVWTRQFAGFGRQYVPPKLVLFDGATQSSCGMGVAQMGPFYCPLDQKVYLDLSFYRDLEKRFGAPGDFARAYVIAHEVGHHVQTLLGISEKVARARSRMSQVEGNNLQVRMELQADCFAGVWAHQAERLEQTLEPGDIEEALGAASAIGDDRIQRQTQGRVTPDSFTHGSSRQRVTWFKRGFETGDIQSCDTFAAQQL